MARLCPVALRVSTLPSTYVKIAGRDQHFESVFAARNVGTRRVVSAAIFTRGFCRVAFDFARPAAQTGAVDSVEGPRVDSASRW
jgi:hypothetical protein